MLQDLQQTLHSAGWRVRKGGRKRSRPPARASYRAYTATYMQEVSEHVPAALSCLPECF